MQTVVDLLNEYGLMVYIIIFGYCALKSGWLPLFAGYAAYAGALDVQYIILATFLGGYLGDELRFIVAKKYGVQWIARSGTFQSLFKHAQRLAEQHGTAYIFMYRYPKGLRTIGALPIGLTSLNWGTFTLLNGSSAALWTAVMVGGGYVFGESFDAFGIENLTAISILLLGVFLWTLYRIWKKNIRQLAVKRPLPASKNEVVD